MDLEDQSLLENDNLTREKRKEVKKKLSIICNRDENINEILNSIEAYCTIILNRLK